MAIWQLVISITNCIESLRYLTIFLTGISKVLCFADAYKFISAAAELFN